ncbi:hypothetical protein MDOR_02540 [Mycolicibacterium doricum]|uniref:Uncharacterized protein n=1 Tax=Mycolicibacterium doricum TaxID=126673 RepID=A0A7I7VP05_9MYCO|nr:hypothetical protein MDOR_02540 [Mycolicibacterium doricum]
MGAHISVIENLPTPELPGQVRTVDNPSCPLSTLGARSRVVGGASLNVAQIACEGNRGKAEAQSRPLAVELLPT